MGVSTLKLVEVFNDLAVITPDPCILTSVVAADTDGTYYGATVMLVDHDGWEILLQVGAGARGTGIWTGRVVCPKGIDVWGQSNGPVPFTIGYE